MVGRVKEMCGGNGAGTVESPVIVGAMITMVKLKGRRLRNAVIIRMDEGWK